MPRYLFLLIFVTLPEILLGQSATQIPPSESTYVQPTVTAGSGDVGGTYFGKVSDPSKTKHYYIAAEPELWNFAPEGQDPVCGRALPSSLLLNRSSWKIRYVQYADANFSARVLPTERLGILGPVLRGVRGQYIEVTFLNRAWRPISMHPHGLKYDKESEGSYYQPNPGHGAAVAPGGKFTYVWYLDEQSAPRPDEPSSKAWLYHSHVVGDEETNLGLIGFIVVTDPARGRSDGTPHDVDREMAALFTIYKESSDGNIEDADDRPASASSTAPQFSWADRQEAEEEGERHTINGRAFGNLTGLEMNEGERVRWYLFGMGSETDFHSAHWHGLRALENGNRRTDVVELLPASMKVADTIADNPGTWLFHCHVAEHMERGMFAPLEVYPRNDKRAGTQPEVAFFGMPQSLVTLRFQEATISPPEADRSGIEVNLRGQVTVPDPFPSAQTTFVVQVNDKSISLQPDASGLAITSEAILLIKNGVQGGNGIVSNGILLFELTLKGRGWVDRLSRKNAQLILRVGEARHQARVTLK